MVIQRAVRRRFAPNWKLAVLAVLLLPLLLSLGNWQLERAAQKRQILAATLERMAMPAIDAREAMAVAEIRYRPVQLDGQFDNGRYFLLDNRVRDGRPGYEVIALFRDRSGQLVWVNRGWVAAPRYREQRPAVPALVGEVAIWGTAYQPLEPPPRHGVADQGWPKVIQTLDFAQLNQLAGESGSPFVVRMADAQPGALRTGWGAVNIQPHKHTGYAVQWFAMALALVVMTLCASFRRHHPATQRIGDES